MVNERERKKKKWANKDKSRKKKKSIRRERKALNSMITWSLVSGICPIITALLQEKDDEDDDFGVYWILQREFGIFTYAPLISLQKRNLQS